MAKTKISEFSATPANNTDIDGINIAEGCAPSGINDAIRELMAQLKDWQSGTSNDPYVIGSSGSLTLNQGTANGVPYLNGSKVVTSGSALTFDGTNFATTGSVTSAGASNSGNLAFTGTSNRITGDFSNATAANRVLFQTSTVNANTALGVIPNGTATFSGVNVYQSSDPANSAVGDLSISGSGGFVRLRSLATGTGTLLPIIFDVGNSERVRIDTSGNVGIGTSSPVRKLDVRNTSADYQLHLGDSASTTLGYELGRENTGGLFKFYGNQTGATGYIFSGVDGERMRIDTSGNVGIGTSSPNNYGSAYRVLQASASDSGIIQVTGTTNSVTNEISTTGTIGQVGTRSNHALAFKTNDTERARIDSSGNLLVGTTATTSNARLAVKTSSTSNLDYGVYVANSGGGFLLGIDNNGGFATGSAAGSPYNATTASAANVFVASSGLLQRSTSSLKYKTEVQDAVHGLADVLKLRSVTYKGKTDGETVFGGLIAEEVHEAGLTEFVQYAEDGSPDALAYGQMVSLCVKAIQEQQAIIAALTARVAALESN